MLKPIIVFIVYQKIIIFKIFYFPFQNQQRLGLKNNPVKNKYMFVFYYDTGTHTVRTVLLCWFRGLLAGRSID